MIKHNEKMVILVLKPKFYVKNSAKYGQSITATIAGKNPQVLGNNWIGQIPAKISFIMLLPSHK